MNEKYQTDGALLVGPVVPSGKITTGERLGVMPENQERFLALAQQFRVRSHSDGWFVDGRGHRTQIWEFGNAKLGLTVTGPKMVGKCCRAGDWLHRQSIGDQEANFWCDWSEENLTRLESLIHLQVRRSNSQGEDTEELDDTPSDEGPETE